MKPSEQINRLERALQLARQESMDLRVALVECVEQLNGQISFADDWGHTVRDGFRLREDAPIRSVVHKARVALGVASRDTLPGEEVRQP